jgi:hypothetical protein
VVTYRNSSSQAAISQRRWKIPGLSQRILTKQLRDLEGAGLVKREFFATVPPRVEYSPTTLMAAVLNAGNNAINQIYDLDIDRVNKPKRPLPSGALSVPEAWVFTVFAFLLAWLLAFVAAPGGRRECFYIVLFTSLLCWIYSAPPLWTKRRGFLANITIAIPRGVLLKVARWSTVKTIFGLEPWYIGGIFGLFLLGAASTKDFADIEGARAGGCRTLPIAYGVKAAAWIIAPFLDAGLQHLRFVDQRRRRHGRASPVGADLPVLVAAAPGPGRCLAREQGTVGR